MEFHFVMITQNYPFVLNALQFLLQSMAEKTAAASYSQMAKCQQLKATSDMIS